MNAGPPDVGERRRAVVVAGHRGEPSIVREHLDDDDATVRVAALGALDRLGELDELALTAAFLDPAPVVRRRAAELAATRHDISLARLLGDDDSSVVEAAVWACGEQVDVDDEVLGRVITLATTADEPLVREAAAASLGAIGDPRGLDAVLACCTDKPHVRRRAVLALAPFDGDDVEVALGRALEDRDWQVRQAAEDLRRAAGEIEVP